MLTKELKLLNDNDAGKSEGIHLMIGCRPVAGQQMLEYTGASDGARLEMLVLHDDAKREFYLWTGRWASRQQGWHV